MQQVGAEVGAPVADVYAALGGGDQLLADQHLHDGVHLSARYAWLA